MTTEQYIQIFEKFTSVPGGGYYLEKCVDFKAIALVFKADGQSYDVLMGEIALNALPGHNSIAGNGLRSWGWYEVTDTDQAQSVSWWAE